MGKRPEVNVKLTRRSGESADDAARRIARETGRPVVVYRVRRGAFGAPATFRLAWRPPEGRPWSVYLPTGDLERCQYGRTSNKGGEAWRAIVKRCQAPAPAPVADGVPPTVDDIVADALAAARQRVAPVVPQWAPPTGAPTMLAPPTGAPVADMAPPAPLEPAPPTVADVAAAAGALAPVTDLPTDLAAYLARLLSPAKRDYAERCAGALAAGEPMPDHPAPWADGVRRRVRRYVEGVSVAG